MFCFYCTNVHFSSNIAKSPYSIVATTTSFLASEDRFVVM